VIWARSLDWKDITFHLADRLKGTMAAGSYLLYRKTEIIVLQIFSTAAKIGTVGTQSDTAT